MANNYHPGQQPAGAAHPRLDAPGQVLYGVGANFWIPGSSGNNGQTHPNVNPASNQNPPTYSHPAGNLRPPCPHRSSYYVGTVPNNHPAPGLVPAAGYGDGRTTPVSNPWVRDGNRVALEQLRHSGGGNGMANGQGRGQPVIQTPSPSPPTPNSPSGGRAARTGLSSASSSSEDLQTLELRRQRQREYEYAAPNTQPWSRANCRVQNDNH